MSFTDYEIESKSDFLTGMYLIARIPEGDLDENALLTIQADCPDFILPFNYKSVNGQTEFTYKVGHLSRLQYFYGDVSHSEYIAIWKGLLSPMLECKDWFMNPGSFVLKADYLYYDKNKRSVAYLYIPSVRECSGYDAFNNMAIDIAKNITVSDHILENKVLRFIINDFNPNNFLKMLIEHLEQSEISTRLPQAGYTQTDSGGRISSMPHDLLPHETLPHELPEPDDSEEFDEKAMTNGQICDIDNLSQKRGKDFIGYKIFSGKSKKQKEPKQNGFKNTIPNHIAVSAEKIEAAPGGATEEVRAVMGTTGFRCIGRANFPQFIEVQISKGEIYTIGRFDANVGKKQSGFEFDAKTKAVSRRHAAIEYDGESYSIIDLSSSAGTFVNDRKLPLNTPHELSAGARVSFGNLGADYVWEIN